MNFRLCGLLSALLLSTISGCGETFGSLLYFLNPFPARKIPACFTLTEGPLLILVDDDQELFTWPAARNVLTDEIGKKLAAAGANAKAFTSNQVNTIKQTDTDFENRSISELGQKMGAEQVLWLQVMDFVATKTFEDTSSTATCTVRVKVFDPNASVKAEMRLWPATREGEYVVVSKKAFEVQKLETDDDVARMLVSEVARLVAELFYDHRPPEE